MHPGILARSDSLIVSAGHGETSHPQVPTYNIQSSCSGSSCTLTEPQTGIAVTVNVNDLVPATGSARAVLTKHDITMLEGTFEDAGISVRSYGAWMRHAAFSVTNEQLTAEDVTLWFRYGAAGGDLTGSAPSGSATWSGIMVGTPASGSGRGNHLQGDAELTFRLSDSTLDADFTNIKNIDLLRDHSVTSVAFNGVPVASGGTFRSGTTGNRIQGGFYGPGHAETAGVFEQSGIVGAFGANRQ